MVAAQRTVRAATNSQKDAGMPGFLEPVWEIVFRVATWAALIFGALSIGSAFVSAWVGWEITDATQKDADKRIKAADERIAEFNARTKEAELALKRLSSDRKLSDGQIADFVGKLRPHTGKKFWIIVQKGPVGDDSEQQMLANQLTNVFLQAGWVRNPHTLKDQAQTDPPTTGIADRGCRVASANDAQTATLAKLVSDELNGAGIDCQLRNIDPQMAPDLVFIEIGLR